MDRPTLSIVVPVYNERVRLPLFLDAAATEAARACREAGLELTEIVVVDDGSRDGTQELLLERAAAEPLIKPVLTNTNRGKGAVVGAGVRQAVGELTLVTDVDLSTPLAELPKLARPTVAGAEVVIGSRALERDLVERSLYRNVMSRGYNMLVRRLTGLPYRDTQCGFKLVRTDVGRALVREQLIERYAFDVETLLRARSAGVEVVEVAVRWRQDKDSRVTPLRTAIRMAADTLWIAWRMRLPAPADVRPPQAARRQPARPLRGQGR